jgi:hypothetical protein
VTVAPCVHLGLRLRAQSYLSRGNVNTPDDLSVELFPNFQKDLKAKPRHLGLYESFSCYKETDRARRRRGPFDGKKEDHCRRFHPERLHAETIFTAPNLGRRFVT